MTDSLNFHRLKGCSREDIFRAFLKQIEVTEEEERDENLKKKRKNKPDLKIMLVKSYDLRPNALNRTLEHLYEGTKRNDSRFRGFVDRFQIEVEELASNIHTMRFYDTKKKKPTHFVVLVEDSYWLVFTVARTDDLQGTFSRIVNFISQLERVELTPLHLEILAQSQEFRESVEGFTARYNPEYQTRRITVRVYGGTLNDLDKLRGLYFVEPTTIQFRKINSPLLEGKFFTNGYISLEKMRPGGFTFASQTLSTLTRFYFNVDKNIYERVERYENTPRLGFEGKCLVPTSKYALVMKIKPSRFEEDRDDRLDLGDLNTRLREYFLNRKNRYILYSLADFSHVVLDRETRNKIQL
ncbi:MAG: hypothetical protein ACTSU5_15705, partial [Promethearchaeota archaeon]